MGMLLTFSARPARSGPAVSKSGATGAKILLFTGVRYDRTPEPGRVRQERAGSRPGKDRSQQ